MHRRTLLATAGSVLVAGCVGKAPSNSGSEQGDAGDTGESAIGARLRSLVGRASPEPVRCKGEPTSVIETMSDAGDENLEYNPTNGTFRVGVAETVDGTRFETVPFEEWMEIECAEAGTRRAREATVGRLDTDGFHASTASLPEKSDSLVALLTVADGDQGNGTAGGKPVALRRLVQVAPRSVEATVSIEGDGYTRTVAVFTEPMRNAVAI